MFYFKKKFLVIFLPIENTPFVILLVLFIHSSIHLSFKNLLLEIQCVIQHTCEFLNKRRQVASEEFAGFLKGRIKVCLNFKADFKDAKIFFPF